LYHSFFCREIMLKYLLKTFLTVLSLSVLYCPAHAQQFTTGTNLVLSLPQQAYKDVVGDIGYGFGGYLLYNWKDKPFKAGAQIAYLILGSKSERIADARVKSTSNAFLVTFSGRLQPQKGFLRPYVQPFVGFQNLNSQIAATVPIGSTLSGRFEDNTHFTMVYGAGVGTWIALQRPSRIGYIGGFGKRGMFLDLGVSYLKGGEAEYLKKGSVSISDQMVNFEEERVSSNLLMFTIGLIFAF